MRGQRGQRGTFFVEGAHGLPAQMRKYRTSESETGDEIGNDDEDVSIGLCIPGDVSHFLYLPLVFLFSFLSFLFLLSLSLLLLLFLLFLSRFILQRFDCSIIKLDLIT